MPFWNLLEFWGVGDGRIHRGMNDDGCNLGRIHRGVAKTLTDKLFAAVKLIDDRNQAYRRLQLERVVFLPFLWFFDKVYVQLYVFQ